MRLGFRLTRSPLHVIVPILLVLLVHTTTPSGAVRQGLPTDFDFISFQIHNPVPIEFRAFARNNPKFVNSVEKVLKGFCDDVTSTELMLGDLTDTKRGVRPLLALQSRDPYPE